MKLFFVSALYAALCTNAFAWSVSVDGPDVFGDTRVLAVESSAQYNIFIQCSTEDEVIFAFAFEKKKFEDVAITPADLFIAIDNDAPVKLPAELRSWNDNYAAIVTTDTQEGLAPIIVSIRNAKGQIKVGVDLRGSRFAGNFSSRGSTKAMQTVLDKCKIAHKE